MIASRALAGRSTIGLERRIGVLDWRYAALLLFSRGFQERSKRPKIGAGIPVKPPLAPKKPLDDWDIESDPEGDFEPTRKCKSLLKKRGRWSLHMAKILATFSSTSLNNAIKWGCLPDECYDAVKTLQKMEATGVLVGKRRLYNYLAGLLHNASPSVVEYVLHSLQREEPAIKRIGGIRDNEMEEYTMSLSDKWFDGLMSGNLNIHNDIHCLPYEMFDREELRWLIKNLKGRIYMRDKLPMKDPLWEHRSTKCVRAENRLRRFLQDLARRDYSGKAYDKAQKEEAKTGVCRPFVLNWK
ncbi:uncharacterized protein LOC112341882 [Selaginella moellendorffii]|uniref:uncharacterized protein LOC112341882 n=1 Tax=Selaginella moellendorffii TaxID=88036 RepID=UPI000D1C8AD1|nr:uncharacterized protein LOC112341882 [Selaginella moellendorffii]|eukprot:XP_024518597.1 uncharacterized protein LOC112341882 [Selaginella moellendorffii]